MHSIIIKTATIIVAVVISFFGYWASVYVPHSTPQKAQHLFDPTVGPFLTVPFAKGYVLFTLDQSGGDQFLAIYVKPTFWGWKIGRVGFSAMNLDSENHLVDFTTMVDDGKTIVWGACISEIKEIEFKHQGRVFTTFPGRYPVWYMILPFEIKVMYHSDLLSWRVVMPNNTVVSLF